MVRSRARSHHHWNLKIEQVPFNEIKQESVSMIQPLANSIFFSALARLHDWRIIWELSPQKRDTSQLNSFILNEYYRVLIRVHTHDGKKIMRKIWRYKILLQWKLTRGLVAVIFSFFLLFNISRSQNESMIKIENAKLHVAQYLCGTIEGFNRTYMHIKVAWNVSIKNKHLCWACARIRRSLLHYDKVITE